MNVDISILFKDPILTQEALLTIEPLAPLSMVSYIPGSYYRTEKIPTKHHICGLFENLLEWHIGEKDRKKILKQMQKSLKKNFQTDIQLDIAASGYQPLLYHLFRIENPHLFKPKVSYFNDLWTQLLYRDGYSHPKGTMNLSYELIPKKNQLKEEGNISNNSIGNFFKDHSEAYPYFYSAPRIREFIEIEGEYHFKLVINKLLLDALQENLLNNDLGYLGTSEGWVHTKIQAL